jgi:hypothetical protein
MCWNGQTLPPDNLPDELLAWYNDHVSHVMHNYHRLHQTIERAWLGTDTNRLRKEIAADWASLPAPVKASLFRRLDGQAYDAIVWKAVKPDHHETFRKEE